MAINAANVVFAHSQKKQMALKDERLKLMNQVLSGVKMLKLYAWEQHFEKKLLDIREQELKYLRKNQLIGAFTFMMFFSTPFVVSHPSVHLHDVLQHAVCGESSQRSHS